MICSRIIASWIVVQYLAETIQAPLFVAIDPNVAGGGKWILSDILVSKLKHN